MRKRIAALKSRLVCCCFTFFLLRVATGDEEIILARPKGELTGPSSWYWTGYKTVGSGWVGPSGSSTSYSVCDVGGLKPSNWLRSDRIHRNQLKKLDIAINYTMTRCSSFADANARQNCTEQFDVYAYQTASKSETDADPSQGNFTKIGTITLPSASVTNQSSSVERVAHLSLIMNERTSTVFFAIHDQGSCLSLVSFVVSYRVCPQETLPNSLVVLRQTVAPTNESEVIKFMGTCAANSVPISLELYAICNSKGEWITPNKSQGYCLCKAGWEKSFTQCKVCSFDHYKDTDGNTRCTKCPKNSYAEANRTSCECSRGFYRTPEEGITHNCTAPPSSPRHAEKLVNQTSVILSWKPPRELGGRSDLYYDVDCKKACGKDQRSCSQDCGSQIVFMPRQSNITQTEMTISNLAPGVTYRFRVYAKNAVSGAAEKEGRVSKHAELEVTTLDSVPGKPVVTVRRISSTSVHVTWRMKDASGRVHYYLLTYYKAEDQSDKHVIKTNATEKRISGLQPGAEYKFVVVARNTMGFGPSSDKITSKDGTLDANGDERRKLWIVIALAAGGTILLLLIVSIIIVVMSRRRKLRKRGQKFEATELYPFRGLSQYVDPSNYGDPMEALKTFAAEIDRSRIKLDCAVGGGEFAEVYKGLFQTPEGTISVAVKILKQGSSDKNKDDFISEASIMGQFKHPNVIDLKGVVTITRPMMIITEFMEGGSLDRFLKTNNGKLTSLQLIGMVRGVSSGMAYLSAINFVHRDLAARNILVGENMICKVSDFGLSRELEDNPDSEYQTQGGKIPIRWTAPEAIRYRKFSSASDIWSFGILLWETMSYGERPYWDWNNFEVIDRVEAGYLLPAPVNCPKIVHNLMLDCWEKDRTKRPKFDEIVRRLDELIRTPNMLRDNFVYYTSSVSADFTKLNTISEWLNSINMGQYAANFKTAGYKDLTQVTCLKDTDLKEMGVTLIGHRNKIYKSIKTMRKHFDNLPEAV